MLELSNLCHCVQHPWKLNSRDIWGSRNKRKPLSKEKFILRKCCGVSHKQWMLEPSYLCHCVQHPWKLTCRDLWSSRNKIKPLSKQKGVLKKWCRLSHKQWMLRAFKPLPLCSAPLKSYLYGISGVSRNDRIPPSKQKCILRKCCRVSHKQWMLRAFKPLALCSAPLIT